MTNHSTHVDEETPYFPGLDPEQAAIPQTLTAREAAERLGLSLRRTQKLAQTGVLQCALDHGKYRIYTCRSRILISHQENTDSGIP